MIHPNAGRWPGIESGSNRIALNQYVLAVGSPCGLRDANVLVVKHGAGIAAIRIHHPEIVLPAAIADKRDVFTVGGISWLEIQGDPGGLRQAFRVSARGRNAINVGE